MKSPKNLMDSIIDTQKKVVENLVDSTKKIYGNNPGTEMMEKGTEMYNNWLEKQKDNLDQINNKAQNLKNQAEQQSEKAKDFYSQWYNTQIDNSKKLWEANQQFFNQNNPAQNAQGFNFFNNNPMNFWTDAMKNYNQFVNDMNNFNKWTNLFQGFNPMNTFQQFQQNFNNTPQFFNSYFNAISSTVKEMQNAFSQMDKQDIFSQLASNAVNYGKFAEIWAPFWNTIKDGSFNTEMFKSVFNPANVKDLTDKMFQLMPDNFQTFFNQNNEFLKQFYNQSMSNGQNMWSNAKSQFEQLQSMFNPFHSFSQQYNQWQQFIQQTAAPFNKMATPNAFTKSMHSWSDILDKVTLYSVKNSELQYMMYLQSQKVMETLAQNIQDKIANNIEITDFNQLYQEWLNISDKVYVELFESEEYSKLMAEVSSLQLKIKKSVDSQIEESLSQFPIATKSELDELYKIIYDLKKEVRQLEKMLELDNETDKNSSSTATAKKTTTKTNKA